MQEIIKGLRDCGVNVSKKLRDERCSFIVISTPRYSSVNIAKRIISLLDENNIAMKAFIWNRSLLPLVSGEINFELNGVVRTSGDALQREIVEEKKLLAMIEAANKHAAPILPVTEELADLTTVDNITQMAKKLL